MNPRRQPAEVRIESADRDSGMFDGSTPVKSEEVRAILSEQHTAAARGEGENLFVRNRSIRISRLKRCEHIMAQPAKFAHRLEREVFVGVEVRHQAADSLA